MCIIHTANANAIRRNVTTFREYLVKNYATDEVANRDDTVKPAIKALLEVVQRGGKNLEICVIETVTKSRMLEVANIEKVVAVVEKEKTVRISTVPT